MRILRIFDRIETAALAVAVIVAGAILAMWIFPPLARVGPHGWSQMTANTSVSMLLLAFGLGVCLKTPRCTWLGQIIGLVVVSLAIATLTEYLFKIDIGIDRILPFDERNQTFPGRPAPQTCAAIALAGISLVTLQAKTRLPSFLADLTTLGLVGTTLVLTAGYAFGAEKLLGVAPTTLTSPQTLLCLTLVTLVVVLRRSSHGGSFQILSTTGIGTQVTLTVMPLVLALPFITFLVVALLVTTQLLTVQYAFALAASSESVLILIIVGWLAKRTNDLESDLRNVAITDELTGVQNVRGFTILGEHAIREARRARTPLSVYFFDLDGLKTINDRYGHKAGSALIVNFANILRASFRNTDIVARVGGDEFAVLTRDDDGASLIRLEEALRVHNAESSEAENIACSVGKSTLDLGIKEPFADMVARADALMYEQKRARKAGKSPGFPASVRSNRV